MAPRCLCTPGPGHPGPGVVYDKSARYIDGKRTDSPGWVTTTDQAGWLLTGDAPLNRRDAFVQWKGSFAPIAGLVGSIMLPHHGAERNFNAEMISYASAAAPFLTVDRKDYATFKRLPRKVRKAIGKGLVAVTEARPLAIVSGPHQGKDYIDDVLKWWQAARYHLQFQRHGNSKSAFEDSLQHGQCQSCSGRGGQADPL